jgi:galactose mutarotase-like enzyme
MQTIQNEFLKVSVDEVGCLLTSVYDKRRKKECLWQKDKAIWASQDVVIFPIIGPAGFDINGVTRVMRQHGFTRESLFTVISKTKNELVMELDANDQTMALYPYKFQLVVHYTLNEEKLIYKIEVINNSLDKMPFMLGLHPGFNIKDGAYIETHAKEYYPCDNNIYQEVAPWNEDKNLKITKDLFKKYMTICLKNSETNIWTLHTNDGYKYIYELNSPLIAIWSHAEKGNYVCIEPWWGFPQYKNMPKELKDRAYVNFCESNTTKVFNFSITFTKE